MQVSYVVSAKLIWTVENVEVMHGLNLLNRDGLPVTNLSAAEVKR